MATPAAFSRLQLAAALLEYDNDLDDPTAPYRSAQDSAIFAHLRRNPAARPDLTSRKSDLLGVSLPSDSASLGGRESALDTRRSRGSKASIDALRNPFAVDNNSEFEEPAEEVGDEALEVDLVSWGLDAFIPKDKAKSAKTQGKQPVPAVVSSRLRRPSTNYDSAATLPRRAVVTSKSASLGGNIEDLHIEPQAERRRSFGSPLDLVGMEPPSVPFHRHRAASQVSFSNHLVPFPATSARSPSPGAEQAYGESRSGMHGRAYSSASMNSRMILDEGREDIGVQQRNVSNDTLGMVKPQEENPFAIQNPSHISRFDPKSVTRARSCSNASMGSRMVLESDDMSVMTGDPYSMERPLSTLELLRPKVLVMPSPLQPISSHVPVQPALNVRDGFELSADGPPLPPAARTSRRFSSSMSLLEAENVPLASNSFTPNPLVDLTLSQKTFRNTLAVPGQSMYPEGTNTLPRATEEGQQAEFDPSSKEEIAELPIPAEGLTHKGSRPAGKLYGKSLIDDLENRKLQMRSKQRVFTGDQRPSMMARDQQRSSTLIDPVSLQKRPTNNRLSSYASQNQQTDLARHPSLTMKPLLTFDGEDDKPLQPSMSANRIPATRSVFGVDTLWQREMAKLKEMEALEHEEREARRIKEEETENKRQKKKDKRKRKDKQMQDIEPYEPYEQPEQAVGAPVATAPPTLPDIQRATRRALPKPSDSDNSSDSDDEDIPFQPIQKEPSWNVDSSDDEDNGPRRTTGTGLRYPKQAHKAIARPIDDDSEEDVPLAATIHKAEVRAMLSGKGFADSDDEDRPLSHVLLRAKSSTSPVKATNQPHNRSFSADEDDDQPLGLRASKINLGPADEDDLPLAFHPEQQRRTQYQMMAQQQQQQQQMMIQAQMQSNMMMNASMMGQSFYPPPMMNPMAMIGMQVPMSVPSPPPNQDDAKFGLVDRWRRDVVVEGEHP